MWLPSSVCFVELRLCYLWLFWRPASEIGQAVQICGCLDGMRRDAPKFTFGDPGQSPRGGNSTIAVVLRARMVSVQRSQRTGRVSWATSFAIASAPEATG